VTRVPLAAWLCALVACSSAVGWSFITPPFQAPDEPSHFAYVKQLAETGSLPTSSGGAFSSEELYALQALRSALIRRDADTRAIFSHREQSELDARLRALQRSSSPGSPAAGVATLQPPLYYALESIPYRLAAGGTLLDRLQLMRLLSALLAGLTALFSYLFLREALPRERWAWTVGALGVALSPLLGLMSGAVNPDAMLFAVSAALFYCLARAFHRGLSTRLAIATGLAIAVGFMTKLNFIGVAPGAYLALAMLARRGARDHERSALRPAAIAAAIGSAPVLLLILVRVASGDGRAAVPSAAIGLPHGSIAAIASYTWQLYLPRLPGMANDFPGLFTARQIWFDGYVGRLGWLDIFFPAWVYDLALALAGLILLACLRALLAARAAVHSRLAELVAYLSMALGLMIVVGAAGFASFPAQPESYGQARYLLPLLPLLGAVLALAARGGGRRWGPALGALLVSLFLAQDLFSQLQAVAHYYG
jgi:4-amino-4-deoxy-L-arabinose transferase-like glycosyltransferase